MLQKLRMPLPQGIKGEDVVTLPQTFDNAVEEASSTFPKGKKMMRIGVFLISPLVQLIDK